MDYDAAANILKQSFETMFEGAGFQSTTSRRC